jgi:hypothetical protein
MAEAVGLRQTRSPKRARRGNNRSRSLKNCTTRHAALIRRKVVKTRSSRPWTSWSGCLSTRPRASRTSPIGSDEASSPRRALLRSPAVRRARRV